MNYLLSLHQSYEWQGVALPSGDILVKAFSALSLFEKIAKILISRISGYEYAHACRLSTPRQGGIEIFDKGVGVYCLLLIGRLAMPSNK